MKVNIGSKIWRFASVIHFVTLVSFDTSWKSQKTTGFMGFSGGKERNQWYEMG